jgi:hypothetical protein
MKQVSLKIGKMRKPDQCIVYPIDSSNPNTRFVQGDRLVLICDIVSRKARCNYKTGSVYCNSLHLVNHPNIEIHELTQEQIDAIIEATPKSGQHLGGGVYLA